MVPLSTTGALLISVFIYVARSTCFYTCTSNEHAHLGSCASDECYRSIKACCVRISKAYAPARRDTATGGAMRFTDLIKSYRVFVLFSQSRELVYNIVCGVFLIADLCLLPWELEKKKKIKKKFLCLTTCGKKVFFGNFRSRKKMFLLLELGRRNNTNNNNNERRDMCCCCFLVFFPTVYKWAHRLQVESLLMSP